MTLPDASARLAHTFLDLLVAQDVTSEALDDAEVDDPAMRQATGAELIAKMLNHDQLSELFAFEWEADGRLKYDMGPMLVAVTAPLLFMATELAGCAQITLDEVIAHCRDYIESQRDTR